MIKLPAQFVKHTGPMATGEHRLTFDVQREFSPLLYQALEQLEKNPQIVLDITIVTNREQASEVVKELEEDLWTRQNKKIHALFDEIAAVKEQFEGSDIKRTIKKELIKKKIIKSSLKELTEEQQADLLNELEERLIEEKFDE